MKQLSYSNVVATIALCCAIGGGGFAFAALKKNSVGTKQIAKNAVREGEIAKNAVTSKKIAAGAVTDQKLGAFTVGAGELLDGSVGTGKLADNAVTTAKLADNAVTGAKVNESTLGEVPLAAAAGRANNVFSAVINSDGSVASSTQPGTTSTRSSPGSGSYSVNFGRELSNCTAVATLGNAGAAIPNPGEIGTSLLNFGAATSSVQVQTRNSAGATADNGFHLVVVC